MKNCAVVLLILLTAGGLWGQSAGINDYFSPVKWRNIGPFRGGRSVASCGVVGDPLTYYMGTTGGGLWKTSDAGQYWHNISDGYFKTGSVGAVAVANSDANVVYVGMGEHAPRGVMTTYGDGVYKSTDAGKSWQHLGLEMTRHIAGISIHPKNPEVVYVAAQGALHGPSTERGVYKSTDGGKTWRKTLYVNEDTGCAHLVMDPTNPRILYAAMWEHRRLPWQVISGGAGSGLYKSTDSGETWSPIQEGLPKELGKMSIAVSGANPEKVYALVESDTEKEQGGLFVSQNGGSSWSRISKEHRLVQRAWYYIEVFADPLDENTVYVLNASAMKSTDGGKSWAEMGDTHGDHHDLWINPDNSHNMVLSNDGGAAISFNGGDTWSTQDNMPTAQFYRINVDNHFPYRIYGGQQDNSSVRIASRNTSGRSITESNWTYSAGGESAFLAFDPDNPRYVMGGSYQGTIEVLDTETGDGRDIMAAPYQYLALKAKDMRYRYNWNAPIIWSQHEPNTFYHGAQVLLKTQDMGISWTEVSPDLTRNDKTKQGKGGAPYTNEGAGGENYGTLSYVLESPHAAGTIWTGSDDGLVHLTQDGGKTWNNVTPKGLAECLINAIEVSPHDPATAYLATTRYKFNDFAPGYYKTTDYGKSWTKINQGIPDGAYSRVIREDSEREGLLLAGTELGLYVSLDGGSSWVSFQGNLPAVPITDLRIHRGDVIAATQGRSFWVLDDLELIRQYQGAKKALFLYQPAEVIRLNGGSPLDGNTDNFDGTDATTGVNPATGMVLYYELTEEMVGEDLELQIIGPTGDVHRTYTSEADDDFKSYDGGPSAEATLPKKAGLNRFVWDLRNESLLGAPEAYIEGSFRGGRVAPGQYTLQLKVGEESLKVKANVLPHPGYEVDDKAYGEQAAFIQAVSVQINTMHQAVNDLQAVRERLVAMMPRIAVTATELRANCQQLLKTIDAWDGKLVQRKSQSYDDVINFENGLTADYFFLKGQADSNFPNVTQAMGARLNELDRMWQPLEEEYQTITGKIIPGLEQKLLDAGIGVLR